MNPPVWLVVVLSVGAAGWKGVNNWSGWVSWASVVGVSWASGVGLVGVSWAKGVGLCKAGDVGLWWVGLYGAARCVGTGLIGMY